MGLRLTYHALRGEFEEALKEKYRPVAEAATGAINQVAEEVKTEARSNIAAAGFSTKWQNALRVNVYPTRDVSANAAAFLYHKIPYSGVFEDGPTAIRGKPLLWLPLSGTPKKIGRNRMSPALYRERIGPLVSIRGGRKPLLGAPVRLSKAAAARDNPKLTLAGLRRGSGGKGVLRTMPLFVGIPTVTLRDRFSIREICQRAAERLPALYVRFFQDE